MSEARSAIDAGPRVGLKRTLAKLAMWLFIAAGLPMVASYYVSQGILLAGDSYENVDDGHVFEIDYMPRHSHTGFKHSWLTSSEYDWFRACSWVFVVGLSIVMIFILIAMGRLMVRALKE